MQNHKFNYRWTLKDAIFSKDKGSVFSCFAGLSVAGSREDAWGVEKKFREGQISSNEKTN